ncbi:hypothetical protein GUITHDRAFT_150565 [Guillardia theta CCMP2712]|uniref:Uncharacterized protein n=1 Tax=Guillardia theta (strain CCMP2712) TaxID=905079 RepID=L1JVY8_GUITC|nr:hypothetical protein GUITHDRAFT_150565 [Guillardia theta CCMP2712]EKX52489.1 hypothetical protein GUITHDRAFT_150565 [Guillardia theta CCMP2712]|eukprot:XP_005839469.1 hypothetical protein GUITHDRAFT_150565 [Guillardia theta CCMP2712]
MPVPVLAVGCLLMVKGGMVMGHYSAKNYDPNPKSAWERENSLPGTDGVPVSQKKKKTGEVKYSADGTAYKT